MYRVDLPRIGTAQAWRAAARRAITNEIPPEGIEWVWDNQGGSLFPTAELPDQAGSLTVPRAFADLADTAIWHCDPERFARLYAMLWRLQKHPRLLRDAADADVARLLTMTKNVKRCIHKLHAFVRFREIGRTNSRRRFAAWFEPTHHSIEPGAPFFARRFGDMDWIIATPDVTACFDNGKLTFDGPAPRPDLPEDGVEDLWCDYFRNIFNPARVKVQAMRSEMPVKYWKNMPETAQIPRLLSEAETRVRQMRDAAPTLPPPRAAKITHRLRTSAEAPPMTLDTLRGMAKEIEISEGYGRMILGEGPVPAALMVLGEQPGETEDREGRPFAGPAGQLFDQIAREAGLSREKAYVTNAVKRFRYEMRGKRRMHKSPDRGDIAHGKWWLDQEIALIRPRLILAMGATAAEALTGSGKGLLKRRGKIEETTACPVFLTIHPAYILRLPDPGLKAQETERFRADLARVAELITSSSCS